MKFFVQLIIRKIIKVVATRCQILRLKCAKFDFDFSYKKFGCMAFSLRSFEDEKKAKMGIVECVKHSLIEPFNVLYEREGEFVAQFKFTLLLLRLQRSPRPRWGSLQRSLRPSSWI